MIFSFLNTSNLGKKYAAAKEYTESLTDPFPDFERIARNRPKENIDRRYPRTTDGTTAAIIRKTGKRVVQQLPTGKVECDYEDWLAVIAEFVYTNRIIPYANEEYDFIQKCWHVIERGMTFGSTATYTPFVSHDGHFSPDLTLPYWGDVFLQPGKTSGYACDYVFMRSWWQEEDVDALIDQQKKLKKAAKERGEEFDSSWDLKALESIKERSTKKDEKAQTPSEEARNSNAEGIEVITGFQKGVEATFYTFVPSAGEDQDDVTVVRTKVNKDPRGKIPIDWYYNDIDGSNPLGRGVVELVGGLQNLIDGDMQAYQWNRALMLNPPVIKRGSFSKKKVIYSPGVIIDVGEDPNADVKPLSVDTSAVANYPDLYGLQKSQLLNLVSSPDTSISAEVGNPGFGKTPSAINAQQATVSVDDNFIRKMFEAWLENWSETAINLYFAEREGTELLQLDEATVKRLMKLAQEGKFDPSMINEKNEILIDYTTATPALHFRVDASTSKMKDDSQQGEILNGLLQSVEASPMLSQLVPPEKILAAWNRIVTNSGVEDPEDLSIDLEEFKQQQEQAMQEQQMMAEQQAQAEMMPQEMPQGMELPPEEIPIEMQPDPEDAQLAEMLMQMGIPESLIQESIDMSNNGYTADQILEALNGVMSDARG